MVARIGCVVREERDWGRVGPGGACGRGVPQRKPQGGRSGLVRGREESGHSGISDGSGDSPHADSQVPAKEYAQGENAPAT